MYVQGLDITSNLYFMPYKRAFERTHLHGSWVGIGIGIGMGSELGWVGSEWSGVRIAGAWEVEVAA